MISEFELIQRYFSFSESQTTGLLLGVGDDAAIINVSATNLLVATDTLVEGVHFPVGFSPEHVATRAMGVNLSDFAAMGAKPRWVTMALSLPLPYANETWLAAFAQSFRACCEQYQIALIGGDTTRSEQLSITLTVLGEPFAESSYTSAEAPDASAESHSNSISTSLAKNILLRSGAMPNDDLWVSGFLAKGAAALAVLQQPDLHAQIQQCAPQDAENLLNSFYAPPPRLELGRRLCGIASAAIDISDGLVVDAEHIANQSEVCLKIDSSLLPVHPVIDVIAPEISLQREWSLSGGDEYELLFTVGSDFRDRIKQLSELTGLSCTCIGTVAEGEGVWVDGAPLVSDEESGLNINSSKRLGYRHF